MKIVILTDQIYAIGGIASLICIKANYWASVMGYEISIITTEQQGKVSFHDLHGDVRMYDLEIDYDRNSSYFKAKNLFKILKNYIRLNKLLKKIQPNIIIIANHIPVTFFFPLLKSKGRFIKEFHFSKYFRSKNKKTFLRRFENYVESKFDAIVVLNEEEKQFYNTNNVVHIPNPVDFRKDEEPDYRGRKKIALAAGRISPVKRFDLLLDIWYRFSKIDSEWNLEIYGNGDIKYENILKQKIKDLNLQQRVQLKKSTKELSDKMQSYGLYLMTSSQECFPMVLLEAQGYGIPIIAYDCPTGPRNIITHDHDGILVPFGESKDFVRELVKLTANEKYRIRLARHSYINSKKYALENIMGIWEDKIINSI